MPGKLAKFGDPFEEWSDNVRSALVWLGYADPIETMNLAREHDPNRQARMAILRAMFNAYGSKPRSAGEMISDAKSGAIKQSGKSLVDAKCSPAAVDLKDAIVQYTSDRMGPNISAGSSSPTSTGSPMASPCVSTYNTHNKMNLWWVERQQVV